MSRPRPITYHPPLLPIPIPVESHRPRSRRYPRQRVRHTHATNRGEWPKSFSVKSNSLWMRRLFIRTKSAMTRFMGLTTGPSPTVTKEGGEKLRIGEVRSRRDRKIAAIRKSNVLTDVRTSAGLWSRAPTLCHGGEVCAVCICHVFQMRPTHTSSSTTRGTASEVIVSPPPPIGLRTLYSPYLKNFQPISRGVPALTNGFSLVKACHAQEGIDNSDLKRGFSKRRITSRGAGW